MRMSSLPAHGNGMFEKLDAFVAAAKHLETELAQERARVRKLQSELMERQQAHERTHREQEIRIRELTIQQTRNEAALDEHRTQEARSQSRLQKIQTDYRKVYEELTQYRAAWSEVLQREREAKLILEESSGIQKRLAELEQRLKSSEEARTSDRQRREQAERHAQTYQEELKNALVRLHSSEAKFNELTRELQAFRESKANFDQEVERVEKSVRERAEWENRKNIEKVRAELERESALAQEKLRDELRARTQADLERVILIEREQQARIREQGEAQRLEVQQRLDQEREESLARQADLEARMEAEREQTQQLRTEFDRRLEVEREQVLQLRIEFDRRLEAEREQLRLQQARTVEAESSQRSVSQEIERLRGENARLVGDAIERSAQHAEERENQRASSEGLVKKVEHLQATVSGELERLQSSVKVREMMAQKELEIEEQRLEVVKTRAGSKGRERSFAKLSQLCNERDLMSARLFELEAAIRSGTRKTVSVLAGGAGLAGL